MTESISKEENSTASRPIGPADLTEVNELRELFTRDDGHTRLLLLLSPT